MEYVLTAAEMKKCDQEAINKYGIDSLVLMERAALETARIIIDKYGKEIYVGVMAGIGNNGGDGIAVARILTEYNIRTEINLIGDFEKCTPETKRQLHSARELGIKVNYGVDHTLYDVIVDALFGIGLTRNVEGNYRKAIEEINASLAKTVSVDIPSGVNADDGRIMGCAVKADITVTYAYRKLGHMLYPGASCAGCVYCVPIGIPSNIIGQKRKGMVTFTDREDLKLPERAPDANKGTFGKLLLIAGSKNMGGACQLSALAAFRIGAGMVKVFTATNNRDALLKKLPEALISAYDDNDENQFLLENEEKELADSLEWADVVAIGPGLSMSAKARAIMRFVVERNTRPLVIDADALNILSGERSLLSMFEYGMRKRDYEIIMTPHLGEFARLMHYPLTEIKKDIIGACRQFAKKYDVSLVCKDARTIVCKRGRLLYVNSSGNDGMATAGSGDVLTGIIAGLLAQGMESFEASVMGVYAHGMAGDMARSRASSYYIMAQDIISSLKYL